MTLQIKTMSKLLAVSFIIATKNEIFTISKQLDYFKKIEFKNVEFIYSDGGSSDGTVETILTASQQDSRIRLVNFGLDKGIYDAWNKALPYANGMYISFLGTDDYPDSKFIEFVTKQIDEISKPFLIYGNVVEISGNIKNYVNHKQIDTLNIKYLNILPFHHQGMAHNRDLFIYYNFDYNLKYAGDTEFLLRTKNYINKEGILYYDGLQITVGSDGISRSHKSMSVYLSEIEYINKKLKLSLKFTPYWIYILYPLSFFPKVFNTLKFIKRTIFNNSN